MIFNCQIDLVSIEKSVLALEQQQSTKQITYLYGKTFEAGKITSDIAANFAKNFDSTLGYMNVMYKGYLAQSIGVTANRIDPIGKVLDDNEYFGWLYAASDIRPIDPLAIGLLTNLKAAGDPTKDLASMEKHLSIVTVQPGGDERSPEFGLAPLVVAPLQLDGSFRDLGVETETGFGSQTNYIQTDGTEISSAKGGWRNNLNAIPIQFRKNLDALSRALSSGSLFGVAVEKSYKRTDIMHLFHYCKKYVKFKKNF